MENCLACDHTDGISHQGKSHKRFAQRLLHFISSFTFEGAEDMSKIK